LRQIFRARRSPSRLTVRRGVAAKGVERPDAPHDLIDRREIRAARLVPHFAVGLRERRVQARDLSRGERDRRLRLPPREDLAQEAAHPARRHAFALGDRCGGSAAPERLRDASVPFGLSRPRLGARGRRPVAARRQRDGAFGHGRNSLGYLEQT
jgi:hypothetical protein